MASREQRIFADAASLSHAAAEAMAVAAAAAVDARGRFTIALSGGTTPRMLYRLLAAEYTTRLPWDVTDVFFGDERCVPPDHPASNFGMARDALLARIPGLEARTRRIEGERPAADAAARYDAVLRTAFAGASGAAPRASDGATFDVLLLGVGADGHTASLFPGSAALAERERWAVPAEAPVGAPVRERVTLTFSALDAARDAYVLCAGADKRPILSAIAAAGAAAPDRYPVARASARGRLCWFIDEAAAPPEMRAT